MIKQNSELISCILEENVTIEENCVLEHCLIRKGTVIATESSFKHKILSLQGVSSEEMNFTQVSIKKERPKENLDENSVKSIE